MNFWCVVSIMSIYMVYGFVPTLGDSLENLACWGVFLAPPAPRHNKIFLLEYTVHPHCGVVQVQCWKNTAGAVSSSAEDLYYANTELGISISMI